VAVCFLAFSLRVQTIVAVFYFLLTSKIFFPTSMIAPIVPFQTFSVFDFLADLLQKSFSVASNLFAYCVFSVHVSAPYSITLWTKVWYIRFFGFVKDIFAPQDKV
jgi:hypothetical protein